MSPQVFLSDPQDFQNRNKQMYLCYFVAEIKMIRNARVTDFKAAVFLKQFFDSYVEVVEVSQMNLTILNGDFKTEVF